MRAKVKLLESLGVLSSAARAFVRYEEDDGALVAVLQELARHEGRIHVVFEEDGRIAVALPMKNENDAVPLLMADTLLGAFTSAMESYKP